MTIALTDKWIWDSWYAHDGEKWHGFFLQAPKAIIDPDLRHFNVSQGHAVSEDLINWTYLGTMFAPAEGPAWDDYTTWTGSVLRDNDGQWHLFYTGANRAEKGLFQRIGHAVSSDMHTWTRVGDGLCLDLDGPVADQYEKDHMIGHWHDRAMRDPWVMPDPNGDGWLMYFTARAPGIAEPNAGGCIGFATSPDLYNWHLEPPIYVGDFGQLEVPQVFQIKGKWYCLFCTSARHWSEGRKTLAGIEPVTGNHYLMADDPRGPWEMAPGFFDGSLPCRRYAARILETDQGHVIIGFDDNGRDKFVGQVRDPQSIIQTSDGLLKVIEPNKSEA